VGYSAGQLPSTSAFNVENIMEVRVLCIVGNDRRSEDWREQFQTSGHSVVRAIDDRQAVEVLNSRAVDLICMDSQTVAETWTEASSLAVENRCPRVPIVLVRTERGMPANFEHYVDVVTNEIGFGSTARWLIGDLREVRFPLFVQWFESLKRRYEQDEPAGP
jgi:hypothetical protein